MPRRASSEASAVYETKWGLTTAKFFLHQLEDLCESVYTAYAHQMNSTTRIV
jgi:hypothetical protein